MAPMPNSDTGSAPMNMPNGTSAQPSVANVPQATRLYHVGSIDFFLDQGDKLNLTTKQTSDLTEIKGKALAQTNGFQTKIVQAEQELFVLTGADAPNQSSISKKIKDIENLRSEQRLSFIKSVGAAGKVLSESQRKNFLAH